jgi:DNA-binding CsgD family transcriptional regulator
MSHTRSGRHSYPRPSCRLASSRGSWPCTATAPGSARQTLLESLTPREKQVLDLMTDRADNRTMAERLQISYATAQGTTVTGHLPAFTSRTASEPASR